MKKIFLGLFTILALSSCKKSGSVEVVVNDDIRSMKLEEFRPINEKASDSERAQYDVFSVVPGTYKIEYGKNKYSGIAYQLSLTIKLRLNHSLRLTDFFYKYATDSFYGDDIHSIPYGKIVNKTVNGQINLDFVALDADGNKVIILDQLFPGYSDLNQYDVLREDGYQKLYEFVTSPAGTEKEITIYASGSKDTPTIVKEITSLYMHCHIDGVHFNEKRARNWVYAN